MKGKSPGGAFNIVSLKNDFARRCQRYLPSENIQVSQQQWDIVQFDYFPDFVNRQVQTKDIHFEVVRNTPQ